MSRITLSILSVFCIATAAYGMQCSFSNNAIDKVLDSCPRFYESKDKSYCCVDLQSQSTYCCDAEEFALKTGLGIIVPAIIAVVVIISLVVLCISCLCCTCCPWYRRRHRGTVYGNLQVPQTAIHVIQPSNGHPGYVGHHMQNQPPVYATHAPAMSQQPPPPQYTQEAYTKQAPYNPGYGQ